MQDQDFDIEVRQTGDSYALEVESPAGEANLTATFPFDKSALQLRLKDLEIALLRSGGTRRRIPTDQENAVQTFGRDLFDWLIQGEARSLFDVSRTRAKQDGAALRVRLRFDAPALAALPWEFLYDPRRAEYVALSTETPLVRYIDLSDPIEPLAVTPPLRVLGMIASPSDLPKLDGEQERHRIDEATKDLQARGLLEIHWMKSASWRDLQAALRRERWHIFHFIGHGGFDHSSEEGVIALVDDQGATFRLAGTELGRLLGDHQTLRLALLNACEGATGSDHDLFSSVAATLVRRGTPAVVAMQYEITDGAAMELSRSFYEAIVDGAPVDLALSEARKAVSVAINNTLEWGTPVLYMRAPDGVLFDVAPLAAAVPSTVAAAAVAPDTAPSDTAPSARSSPGVESAPSSIPESSPVAAIAAPATAGSPPLSGALPSNPPRTTRRGVSCTVYIGILSTLALVAVVGSISLFSFGAPVATFIAVGTPTSPPSPSASPSVAPTLSPEDEALKEMLPASIRDGCSHYTRSGGSESSEQLGSLRCSVDSPVITQVTFQTYRSANALDGRWTNALLIPHPTGDPDACWGGGEGETTWSGGRLQCDRYRGPNGTSRPGDAELRWTNDKALMYGAILGDQTAAIADLVRWWQAVPEPYAQPVVASTTPSASAPPPTPSISPSLAPSPSPTTSLPASATPSVSGSPPPTIAPSLSPDDTALVAQVPSAIRDSCQPFQFNDNLVTAHKGGLKCTVDGATIDSVKYASYSDLISLSDQWETTIGNFGNGPDSCGATLIGEPVWEGGSVLCSFKGNDGSWAVHWTNDDLLTYAIVRGQPGGGLQDVVDFWKPIALVQGTEP